MDTVEKQPEPQQEVATGRHYNESAIHAHAIACSDAIKGGKFTRVSEEFIIEVKADVDAFLRKLSNAEWPVQIHDPVPCEQPTFITGALTQHFQDALNIAIARLIQRKVEKQPSCGKTLSRTR